MIDYPYKECGAYGHAWFDYDSTWTPQWGTPVTLRCARCESERRESWSDVSGSLINRHYDYAIGYSFKGQQRPSRDDFRKMIMEEKNKNKYAQRVMRRGLTRVK